MLILGDLIFSSGDSGDFDDSRDSSEFWYFGEIGVFRKYGD